MYILFNQDSLLSLIFTCTYFFSRVKSSLQITSVTTFLLLCPWQWHLSKSWDGSDCGGLAIVHTITLFVLEKKQNHHIDPHKPHPIFTKCAGNTTQITHHYNTSVPIWKEEGSGWKAKTQPLCQRTGTDFSLMFLCLKQPVHSNTTIHATTNIKKPARTM